jgi:hypothetical protein
MLYSSDRSWPTRIFGRETPLSTFFKEPNTWEGPWRGFATHILDIAYLFQNINDHLTGAQRNVAIQFATDVITFANENALFPPFGFKMTE